MAAPELGLPQLPPGVRFDRRGRLVVSAAKRRIALPVVQLFDARLSTIRGLLKAPEPQVILAPHLTRAARQAIERAGWGWLETTGNAHVEADGVLLHIERPDSREFRQSGNIVIPPQGERIIRLLLDTYPRMHRVSEIARLTKLDLGYASRILKRLRMTGLVIYERRALVEVASPPELFELWQKARRRVIESAWYVARPNRLQSIAEQIQVRAGAEGSCLTGMFAAGLLTRHLEADRLDCYVGDVRRAARIGEALSAERVDRGANVVFLVHRDPGVLTVGTRNQSGLRLSSVSQIYMDALERGRGREREVANELRRRLLRW